MFNLEPERKTVATSGAALVLCILTIYVGITTMGQNEIVAQDKSTSITCTDASPCEMTECFNGECETTATNSSNISSTIGSDEKDSDRRESIRDLLKDRLGMRDN